MQGQRNWWVWTDFNYLKQSGVQNIFPQKGITTTSFNHLNYMTIL